MTKKIGIILGTRPEAIKLAPVIQVFQSSPDVKVQVILTGDAAIQPQGRS
jgi:UDP-N-acetylglucosamine 2-epimerase (non-hydrolysing)